MAEQSGNIFISYRRDDSIAHVNGLFLLLRDHFGKNRVFKDTDNIPPGRDFRKVIETQLKSCSVLLAVIGRNWLNAQSAKSHTRRLDDPNDYLRIEVSKALGDEGVLVIPILVGQATMPSPEELPADLTQLAYLNAFELRDSRWESDIHLLIEAIGAAELQPRAAPDPSLLQRPAPVESTPVQEEATLVAPADDAVDLLELRRRRQIAEHLKTARETFAAHDYELAVAACEKAIWLDAQNTEARDLRNRARAALDEQKIAVWLTQADAVITRHGVEDTELAIASGFIDQALALNPAHALAMQRRQQLLSMRKQRERQREIDRQGRAALARAQASFDEEDFDAALQYCEDALLLASESEAARALQAKILAAKAEEHRQRDLKRQARRTAEEAKRAGQIAVTEETLRAETELGEKKAAGDDTRHAEAVARERKAAADLRPGADVGKGAARLEAERWEGVTLQTDATPVSAESDLPARQPASRGGFGARGVAAAAVALIAVVAVVLWSVLGGRGRADVSEQVPAVASPSGQPTRAVDDAGAAPPASGGAPADAVAPRENPPTESAAASELAALRQRAQEQYQAGQGTEALDTSMAGLKLVPTDPDLLRTLTALRTDAESTLQKAKKEAASAQAASRAAAQVKLAAQKEAEAERLRNDNRPDEAIRALWAAADEYTKAAHAGRIASQLNAIVTRARTELKSGQRARALNTTLEGLRLDPSFAPLQDVVAALWRDAQGAVERSKQQASEGGASVTSAPEYQEALRRVTEATRLRDANKPGDALKTLWAANELFTKATELAEEAREPAKPAASPPRVEPPVSVPPQEFQADIVVSNLASADLTRELAAGKGQVRHKSEVARGGPAAAVVWTSGCQKDSSGMCRVNVDMVVYAPDGSVFHEAKNVNFPDGSGAVPLTFDAQSPPGLYRLVVLIRDLEARRFAKHERQFGVR